METENTKANTNTKLGVEATQTQEPKPTQGSFQPRAASFSSATCGGKSVNRNARNGERRSSTQGCLGVGPEDDRWPPRIWGEWCGTLGWALAQKLPLLAFQAACAL